MDKVGEAYIRNAEVDNAYSAYKFSENTEMISFLEENFIR